MSSDPQIHSAILELAEAAPPELPIGTDLTVKIKLACPHGCDLSGVPLAIASPDATHVAAQPAGEITLKAPERVGEHVWSIRFAAPAHDGVLHEERALAVSLRTRPHTTSLAVWAVPAPVVMGERFAVKVGVKSSAGEDLRGTRIAVSDTNGAVIGEGTLRDTPWPGTSALYWTDVELIAPRREGVFWCTVNFAATDIARAHDGASSRFSVAIVPAPEHRLTVEVREKDTMVPIEDAQIRLGAYRAATDPCGRAEVALPKGIYDLTIWKVGYDAPGRLVDVHGDVELRVEATVVPPENPDAYWLA